MLLTSKKKEERQAERGSENQVKVSFRLQTSSNQSQTWEPDVSFVPEGKSVSIVARFIWQQWLFLTVTAQHSSIRFRESFGKSFFMMGFFTQDNFLFFFICVLSFLRFIWGGMWSRQRCFCGFDASPEAWLVETCCHERRKRRRRRGSPVIMTHSRIRERLPLPHTEKDN